MTTSCPARDRESDAAQHGDVEPQVGTRAVKTVVSEDISNRLHPYAPGEQAHGERVAKAVDMLAAVRESCLAYALTEDIPGGGPLQRDPRTACPNKEHRRVACVGRAAILEVGAQ